MTTGEHEGEDAYIVEFVAVGKSLKVTAVDPVSLREVTMVGALKISRQRLAELAVRKLKYVLERDKDI
jgi:hypothetical protein